MAALAAGTALIALQTAPAFAEGTNAGTTITNTATVDYEVGGVQQTQETASDSFTVDRKVNLTVALVGGPTTSVVPGEAGAVITFDVANLSNDTIDAVLAVTQAASGDDFDVGNVRIVIDDGNGVYDAGDTEAALIDEIAEDATVRVFVVSDIPLGRANDDLANLTLSATAHEGGAPGSQGAVLTATSGANTNGIDTVLADSAGSDDSANDGIFSTRGGYSVTAATLTVTKTNRVLQDPVNGSTNPKAIPGAEVEYCVAVSNAAGSALATNIVVTDVVPADLTIVAGSILVDGTLDGSNNCTGGSAGGSISGQTVTAPLSDIAGGETRTAAFRVTIN
ncbi:hypothetical protein [Porphyrobacter sp. YT40]|uniref:hypothetical protein n=1 Tax=Porphyrobacter sp. YT40 TaxID=2547601 RepID=UPI0025732E8D|nr:hypothetical protein [Porphyrobacter sp. YT40]